MAAKTPMTYSTSSQLIMLAAMAQQLQQGKAVSINDMRFVLSLADSVKTARSHQLDCPKARED